MPSAPKLQRWTDLLAALLRRHGGVEFDTIRREVPAYAEPSRKIETVLRMFERDKDELRALGVPIDTIVGTDGTLNQYRLASRDFYLPFLQLAYEQPRRPTRPKGPGYQSLPVLAFEPEELDAIARAAHRVRALGDPALATTAGRALRKLGHDLPVPRDTPHEHVALDQRVATETLEPLRDALRRRKVVRFTYHSMHRDATEPRRVDPYGLAFLSGHWYLIGRDHGSDAIRQFRVSRIHEVAVNGERAQSADFAIPDDFDLSAHARSRLAWELGDAEQITVTVRFLVQNGFTTPAMRLGEPVVGKPMHRRFRVCRTDTFALWVLGFAGDVVVEAPRTLAARVRTLAQQTRAHYTED